MTGKCFSLLLLQMVFVFAESWAQRSPYSLQAAVDEMHRREAAKYPLNSPPSQQHYFGSALGSANDQDYWDDDTGPTSVFRERTEPHTANGGGDHAELTEQFLREIEEAQEHDREERYKEALRNLWEKYQQQENEIDGDLFEEKKRMRTPPYYMLMQKKRSYPVLPWLPYADRRKRFPVAKRAAKRSTRDSTKTDERVERELSELFGTTIDEKKKRSIDEQTKISTTHSPNIAPPTTTITDMRLEGKKENSTDEATKTALTIDNNHHGHAGHHGGHAEKEHKHRKRSEHNSHESREDDSDSDEDHEEHEEEGGEEEYEHEDFEDDDEEERKKKRDVSDGRSAGNLEIFKAVQTPSRKFDFRKKKSIDWSKYFGLDRKKKSMSNDLSDDMKKRNANDENDKKKREIDPEKLDNMDKKLQSIEDFIIDETIKYTGAHEGIANPEEIRRLKDHVLSRLATAYSLEKMRRALEKLRQSVDTENHLLRNVIEAEGTDNVNNQKRLSVKKEQAILHDNQHLLNYDKNRDLNSNGIHNTDDKNGNSSESNEDSNEDDEIIKKKKKRNGYLRYPELPNDFADIEDELGPSGRYETLNDAYLGNKNYIIGSKQCPLIESMAERCRGVDILSGDLNQELLPICGVHQICYLCGSSQVACDYQYLAEADGICGNNNDCEAAARSVLMILRGTPGPQLGPRECLKNPCLYSAMREIGL